MKAEYLQRGEALDYKNGTDATIPAGAIVDLKTRIGVAGTDILPGAIGSVHVMGVFTMPKKSSEDIKQGEALYFDKESNDGEITKTGSDSTPPAGFAAYDSGAEETTVAVSIGAPPAPVAAASPVSSIKNLNDLEDVDAASPSEGDTLTYQSGKWKNQASEAV